MTSQNLHVSDVRVTDFMTRIRNRAAEQEASALRPLATVGAGARTPLAPAAPAWCNPRTDIPKEQPCKFVQSMIERNRQPQKLWRAIHGKDAA